MKIKQNVFLDVQVTQIDLLPKFKGIREMLLIRNFFHNQLHIRYGYKKSWKQEAYHCTKSAHRPPHNK